MMHLLRADTEQVDLLIDCTATTSERADAIVAFDAFTDGHRPNGGLTPGLYPFHVEADGNALIGRSLS